MRSYVRENAYYKKSFDIFKRFFEVSYSETKPNFY